MQHVKPSFRMTGVCAVVEWGYHVAADLGAWELRDGFIRARIVRADPFRLRQAPLWFTVDNSASGKPPFQRLFVDATIAGGYLTGRLGPRKQA
jgi:hypothetical protein